jgi:uroporphyrinogen-III synthase
MRGTQHDGALEGLRIVVTRARDQAAELADRLTSLGAIVIALPAIEVVPVSPAALDEALDHLELYDWILFTSANAVDIFFDRMSARGGRIGGDSGPRTGAIGRATAERVRRRGGAVDYVPEEAVAESLLSGLVELGVSGNRILMPRARVARDILPEGLRSAGASVDVVAVYETRMPEPAGDAIQQLMTGEVDCFTFASQSSVRNTLEMLGGTLPHGAKVACIGPVTADAARAMGLQVDILATEYSLTGLVDALVTHLGVSRKAGKR